VHSQHSLHNILSADSTPPQVADFRISGAASTFQGKPSNFSVTNCINKTELSVGRKTPEAGCKLM
jgi:hypothetical protein